jgi:cardiolipin synthase
VLFHAVLAPATALHALLFKRDSRAAFGWIAVCILFPVGGPVLYLFFGLNRARGRAQRMGLTGLSVDFERGRSVARTHPLPTEIDPDYRNLARIGQVLSRHALEPNNEVDVLINGEAAYPAMLEAIAGARERIVLATYIFEHDDTGHAFREALVAARERDVEVQILIDGVGDLYSAGRARRALSRAGLRVARFLPPRLIPPSLSINMRNHHKILVIDDRVGFTGGMNIGDRHRVDPPATSRPNADLHFRLRGPVVAHMRAEFERMWQFTTGEPSVSKLAFVPSRGELACRVVTDGPDEDLDRLTVLLTAAIAEARKSIRIMTPYFLPPRELVGAIQAAAIRGVRVTVVLPERSNLPYVDWATRNMLWEILFRGAHVHYQPGPFNHAKLFVVDGYYCLIGSSNWDPRSLRLNFELQVEVYGRDFASEISAYIDAAVERGRAVSLAEVDQRSLPTRLRDSLCWLFSPYL